MVILPSEVPALYDIFMFLIFAFVAGLFGLLLVWLWGGGRVLDE